jgi:tartrate-resistant acid phosphatase type 5
MRTPTPPSSLHSRRQFLQTFSFSAAALLAGRFDLRAAAQADARAEHMFLFGDWGAQGSIDPQQQVARAMAGYASEQGIRPSALFLLGDNFYGQLEGGVSSPRWQSQFEAMYPPSQFGGPCYALLGNHDYNVEPAGKTEAQLAYAAAHPGTRWTLPSKWYRFDFPAVRPLVTFLALDSNYQKATAEKLSLTPEERVAQAQWLKAELAKPRTTRYLVVCGHHPLYSNAGDSPALIAEWDALLREHAAHLYFCGHIHDLEHLEFAGHPTSFVVSGGGGTTLREKQTTKSSALNHFGQGVHGFTHLEVSDARLVIRHLGADGKQLHAFAKAPQGAVELL